MHAKGDANLLIVQSEIACAETGQQSVLIGDDTDLVVLLSHHAKLSHGKLLFHSEPRKASLKGSVYLDIAAGQTALGQEVCDHILFVHALLGCDTTSLVYGIGKSAALNLARNNQHFREQASIFLQSQPQVDDIIKAGEMRWSACMVGNQESHWMNCDWPSFWTEQHQVLRLWTPSIYPLHQQPPNIIPWGSITKSNPGKG